MHGLPESGVQSGQPILPADEPPLLAHLDRLIGELHTQAPKALNDWDEEGIHRARVATRRLSAALDLVKPVVGKKRRKATLNDFLFRRTFHCGTCGRALTGERQKGVVYYRCHVRTCPLTSVREDLIESKVFQLFGELCISQTEFDLEYARAGCDAFPQSSQDALASNVASEPQLRMPRRQYARSRRRPRHRSCR